MGASRDLCTIQLSGNSEGIVNSYLIKYRVIIRLLD